MLHTIVDLSDDAEYMKMILMCRQFNTHVRSPHDLKKAMIPQMNLNPDKKRTNQQQKVSPCLRKS